MADNNERVYADHSEYIMGEGGLTRDAKSIGDKGVVALSVACNYKTFRGEEGVFFRDVLVRRPWATEAKNFKKGERITFAGWVEGSKYTDNNGNEHQNTTVVADMVGRSVKFAGYRNGGGGGSSQSNRSNSGPVDDTPPFDVDNSSNDDDGLDLNSLI